MPPGTSGQVCPPSGGGLCDYCNPQQPECKEPDARCIVTNSHETFCGRPCSHESPCPTDYSCMVVKTPGAETAYPCVPSDKSCYY